MSVDLYGLYTCSSCRAILLTAEAIGIEVNLINVDLENGEHQTPEYEEVNKINFSVIEYFFNMKKLFSPKKYVYYM